MSESLDNLLSDEVQVVEKTEVVEPKVEIVKEVVGERPAEKVEVKPEVKAEKPEQQKMTDKERALLASAMDERRKRQDLERRLAEFEAKQQPVEEPKQFWENPEEQISNFRNEMLQMKQQIKLDSIEDVARAKYSDFDEKIDIFANVLQQTPGLREQWLSSPNPAEYAYKLGKNYQDLNNAGNLDTMMASKEKELRIKIENEFKEKEEKRQNELNSLPGSLSSARGTSNNNQVWNGPSSLGDILKG